MSNAHANSGLLGVSAAGMPTSPSSTNAGSESTHSPNTSATYGLTATDLAATSPSLAAATPQTSLSSTTTTSAPPPLMDSQSLNNVAAASSSATPAACLCCRSKHLKCDGQMPCARCRNSNLECIYVASRRGYKGPRKTMVQNPNKRRASDSPTSAGAGAAVWTDDPSITAAASMYLGVAAGANITTPTPASSASTLLATPYAAATAMDPSGAACSITIPSPSATLAPAARLSAPPFSVPSLSAVPSPAQSVADRCFDSFYYHYHPAHPFILPKPYLLRLLSSGTTNLDHLLHAMRFLGGLYLGIGPVKVVFCDEALRLCNLPSTPKDGFLVQTLLLLLLGLDGTCQLDRARQLLDECERIALDIGLNTRQFATLHGQGDPVLEESWRRTWWDLYVCDGMIAGTHRQTNFLLYDAPANVGLPCEELEYLSGNIPQILYMEDLDDQVFADEERVFSSFAYRIASARNMGALMRMPQNVFPGEQTLDHLEALLSNWRMHLPPCKRHDLDKNCQLDEMMFQAHFINQGCSIMLHQPFSQLDSSPARTVTACAPHRPIPSGDVFNAHTRHTIQAAREISKMTTQAVPMLSHTHFFACVITLSSIIHLSKWALYFVQDAAHDQELIRLNIGALAQLARVWRNAETAGGQVRSVAREIYRAKKAQQISPSFWVGFTREEMIHSLNQDEAIMHEMESIMGQVTQAPPGS